MFFDHQRDDNGPIFVKTLTPMSVSSRLELIVRETLTILPGNKVLQTTDNGVYRAARSQLKSHSCSDEYSQTKGELVRAHFRNF